MPKNIIIFILAILMVACSKHSGLSGAAYISNEDSGMVSIVDLGTIKLVDSIQVGKLPRGIRLSADGQELYVALSGSPKCPPAMSEEECKNQSKDKAADGIAEIDLLSRKIVRMLPGGSDPEQFDIDPYGKLLVVSNEDMGMVAIIDLVSGTILKQLAVGKEPEGVRLTPDHKWVLVTNEAYATVSFIKTATLEVVGTVPVGHRPRDICFDPDKKLGYVSNEISNSISILDLESHRNIGQISFPAALLPMGLALDTDSQILFVTTGRGQKLIAIDVQNRTAIRDVIIGKRPWGIDLSDDKNYLITANGPSNTISIVHTGTFEIIKKIQVGKNPWGVVIGPDL